MKRVRRGRQSDAIFALATQARYHYRSADPSAPNAPRVRKVNVSEVRRAYESDRALKMTQMGPGHFVIVIPNKYAYEHYELMT